MTSHPYDDLLHSQSSLEKLVAIMRALRDPERGCPWDLKQTFQSIASYTIEEAYEVHDAIMRADMDDLKDELGDLLLQVVYHAQLAQEQNYFQLDDCLEAICEKMIRRHPHVFAHEQEQCLDAIAANWQRIKQEEQNTKNADLGSGSKDREKPSDSLSDSLKDKPYLPPLLRSIVLQKQAAKLKFDWPDAEPVFEKIAEELAESREAFAEMKAGESKEHLEEEIGDMLFAITNLARHCDIDCDRALTRTNEKFINRFNAMISKIADQGLDIKSITSEDMEAIYISIKSDSDLKNKLHL
jgi:ATP diphosphatase